MKIEYNNHSSKSHTGKELIAAYLAGKKIWILNSGTSGNDDIVIGEKYEEIMTELLEFHGLEKMPENWKLRLAECEIVDDDELSIC